MKHFNNSNGVVVYGILFGLFLVLIVGWGAVRIISNINFNRHCEGYIKRAADANTVSLAETQLEKALAYIEREQLTEGYTSVFWKTPDEDIGFWYNNLKSSLSELKTLPANSSALEKSNMLMKLRETLLDHTSSGTSVTVPGGISVYPYNSPLAYASIILSIFCLFFGCIFFWKLEDL